METGWRSQDWEMRKKRKEMNSTVMCMHLGLNTIMHRAKRTPRQISLLPSVSRPRSIIRQLRKCGPEWTGSLLLGCHDNTNSSPSAPAHFWPEYHKSRQSSSGCCRSLVVTGLKKSLALSLVRARRFLFVFLVQRTHWFQPLARKKNSKKMRTFGQVRVDKY